MIVKINKKQKEYFKLENEDIINLLEKQEPVFLYKGRKIYDLKHSQTEFEKHTKKPLTLWQSTIKKGINKIITTYRDKAGDYVIVNKKFNFGIPVDWRKDFEDMNGKNHAFIPTTLGSQEMNYYTKPAIEIFVEQLKEIKIFERKTNKQVFDTNKIPYTRIKHINEDMKKGEFNIFIQNGNIKYCYDIIIVE